MNERVPVRLLDLKACAEYVRAADAWGDSIRLGRPMSDEDGGSSG